MLSIKFGCPWSRQWICHGHREAVQQSRPSRLRIPNRQHLQKWNPVVCLAVKSAVSDSGGPKRRKKTKKTKGDSYEQQEMAELLKIVQLLPKNAQRALQPHPDLHNVDRFEYWENLRVSIVAGGGDGLGTRSIRTVCRWRFGFE